MVKEEERRDIFPEKVTTRVIHFNLIYCLIRIRGLTLQTQNKREPQFLSPAVFVFFLFTAQRTHCVFPTVLMKVEMFLSVMV